MASAKGLRCSSDFGHTYMQKEHMRARKSSAHALWLGYEQRLERISGEGHHSFRESEGFPLNLL